MKTKILPVLTVALLLIPNSNAEEPVLLGFWEPTTLNGDGGFARARDGFYHALSQSNVDEALAHTLEITPSFANGEATLRKELERRKGAKQFIGLRWIPQKPDNETIWLVLGVFVDSKGRFLHGEQVESQFLNNTFMDIWMRTEDGWKMMPEGFLDLDFDIARELVVNPPEKRGFEHAQSPKAR